MLGAAPGPLEAELLEVAPVEAVAPVVPALPDDDNASELGQLDPGGGDEPALGCPSFHAWLAGQET